MLLVTNANLQLADLLASKKPVILGAPPLHDSESLKAKRVFYNGKVDYEGPARLVNRAMTRIKRQIGGGKATNRMKAQDSDDDELSSLSPSPAPVKLRSKSQKAMTDSVVNIVEGRDSLLPKKVPKSTHGRKRVEVVLTTAARNTRKRAPSVIVVGDSSGAEETNVGGSKVLGDSAEHFTSDEQDPPICKRKEKSLQSSSATNTTQPDSSEFASEDEKDPSVRKHKAKSQQSSRATK